VNFRDVGGVRTPTGPVRRGLVYRSDALHLASEAGVDALRSLGVTSVLDLRSAEERERSPGPLPSRHHPIQDHLVEDGIDATACSGIEGGEALLRTLYVRLLDRAAPRFGVALTELAHPGRLPVVVHCASGKDRTGLFVALLLSVLGVDRETVLDDYATPRTSAVHLERVDALRSVLVSQGIEADAAEGMLGTPRWAMADALADLDRRHGSVESYLVRAAGVGPETIDSLRNLLVEQDRASRGS